MNQKQTGMAGKREKFINLTFGAVLLISTIALLGWLLNRLELARIHEDYIPMAPFTAVSFLILSVVSLSFSPENKKTVVIRILLIIHSLVMLTILADSFFGYQIDIESHLSKTELTFNDMVIGRMSPLTIILFLISLATLISHTTNKKKARQLSVYFCTFGAIISFILDLGYLYNAPLFYHVNIIPPALNTAISFSLLFGGMLAKLGTHEKPLSWFSGESVRARMMRNFTPLTLLIVVLSGWLNTLIFNFYNDHVFISAVITLLSLAVLSIIVFRISDRIGSEIDQASASREKAEKNLRESELHFRTMANSGQALIWTSGTDKKCDYFNDPWLNFTGRKLEQELGDGWLEGVYPDDLQRCLDVYSTAFDNREKFNMEYRLRFNDGTYRWIHDSGSPRYNTNSEFIGYVGHCLDINDLRTTEEKIKEREEKYRLISSISTDYTFSTKINPDGSYYLDWIAGALESISGYTLEEYEARGGWRSIIHPDDRTIDTRDFARLCKNQNIESELRTINKKGEIVWVQVYAHPIWDKEKNCLSGIYGSVKNINDRKLAEAKLIASETQFRELMEKINLVAVIINTNGIITFCNDYLLKLSGYQRDELLGKNWFDTMLPKSKIRIREILEEGVKNGEMPLRFKNAIITKDNRLLDIAWSNVIRRNDKGEITGVSAIGEDITEQKLAEQKIRTLNIELEKKVLERTYELENKNAELTRMNKLFVGRELRMIELKNEIKELSDKLENCQHINKAN